MPFLKNLAKSVAADGEGASKYVTIRVEKCKNENDRSAWKKK